MSAAPTSAAASTGKDSKSEQKEVDGNAVWISTTKSIRFYADIALRMMIKNEQVELHGLGAAVAATVDLAQHLVHLKKATIIKIATALAAGSNGVGGRKPEIVVTLKRNAIPTLPEALTEDQLKLVQITEDNDDDH